MNKGINAADILNVMLMLPKNHPTRFLLINLMNTAILKRALPPAKENLFHRACIQLQKEGLL